MEFWVLLCHLVVIFQAGSCLLPEEEWESNVGMKPGKYPKGMGQDGPEWGTRFPVTYPKPEYGARIPFLPPKYKPGDVIDELELREVSDALDIILTSGDLIHDRRCALSVSNEGASLLTNPRWYLDSGGIHSPPGPQVEAAHTGLNLFLKTPWAARGSVGVITYDIMGTEFKVAIMFSVPFDRNIFSNWFNYKIYPQSVTVDKDMYRQLYYYAGPWLAQGWQERTEYGIHLRGVMTDSIESKLSLWINSADHQPDGEPERWSDCDYHAGWFGKYCWRECTPQGWCWLDKECESTEDCLDSPYECYSGCKGP